MNAKLKSRIGKIPQKPCDWQKPAKKKPAAAADKPAAAAAAALPLPPPNNVECYYDSLRSCYWTTNARGNWHEIGRSDLKLLLRRHGYRLDRWDSPQLNQVEAKMLEIIHDHGVDYAGPVAGYQPGRVEMAGMEVLVTRGPKLIEPKKGTCPTIKSLVRSLFGKQWMYAYGWLKWARESMMAGPPWRPGQVLVLAGDTRNGKSLFQYLVTEILGGRVADPYRYMIGDTTFNSDLIGSEHLMLEDKVAAKDYRAREQMAANIKAFAVNRNQSGHKKKGDALTLRPFWRMTISLNCEPENMMVLPPITSDIKDKVMLLRTGRAEMPYEAGDTEGYFAYWNTLIGEIPAFLWNLDRWEIPKELREIRMGIKEYHDPVLLDAINALSKEQRLWDFILSSKLWNGGITMWEGTAADLVKELKASHSPADIDRLLHYSTACGVFLSRLSKTMPGHVVKVEISREVSQWKIFRNGIDVPS